MREFNMMEVELFVDPRTRAGADSARSGTANSPDTFRTADHRHRREAVSRNIIVNEVLAYFVYATKQLLMSIGVKEDKIRFRQHLSDEMAHYAGGLLGCGKWSCHMDGPRSQGLPTGCWDLPACQVLRAGDDSLQEIRRAQGDRGEGSRPSTSAWPQVQEPRQGYSGGNRSTGSSTSRMTA